MTCRCTKIMYVQFMPWTKLSLTTQFYPGDVCVIKFCGLRHATQLIPGGLEPTYYFSSRYRPFNLNFSKKVRVPNKFTDLFVNSGMLHCLY
jgi:hypothetical protein